MGLPKRQRLVGAWLLLSGLSGFAGLAAALWLDARLTPQGAERLALWAASLASGALLFLLGALLERRLLRPLRHLQVLVARLVANPDARDDYPPEGWLAGLAPDLRRLREEWRGDRQRLATAHAEGARSAARIRQELEALLQLLETPLLLCDRHHRLLLFNQATERLFADHPGLGLGKRLAGLLPQASLREALQRLPEDGTPRELLVPLGEHWLRAMLRRVPSQHEETLITLEDATAAWHSELGPRAGLAELLPRLRGHGANLVSAAEALGRLGERDAALRQRLTRAVQEESERLGEVIHGLGELTESLQQQGERLLPTWSNDLFEALNERLAQGGLAIRPIGIPAWLKADAPALLGLLEALVEEVAGATDQSCLEVEACLGNKRVYLDLVWRGAPLSQGRLAQWQSRRLEQLPLAPSLQALLRQHASELWSLADEDGQHARLRLPLPAAERVGAPRPRVRPRPEFHDFGIAELPPPDAELASRPLTALEVVAFDTETTGLALRQGDKVISLGACRIVNGRLLADDTFDVRIDPERPIPPESTAIHGLRDQDVAGAPPLAQVLPRFRDYVGDAVLLAHNAAFDLLALQPAGGDARFEMPVLDTLLLSRALDPGLDGHDLDSLAERYGLTIPPEARHTALGDARLTAELWLHLLPRLQAREISRLDQLLQLQRSAFDREDASA